MFHKRNSAKSVRERAILAVRIAKFDHSENQSEFQVISRKKKKQFLKFTEIFADVGWGSAPLIFIHIIFYFVYCIALACSTGGLIPKPSVLKDSIVFVIIAIAGKRGAVPY